VGTTVVRRNDFEVLHLAAPIPVLILNTNVGNLDVVLLVRQPMRQRPLLDFIDGSVWAAVAVPFVPVPLLKETLVLAPQLVVEDDAADVSAPLTNAAGGMFVGPIELSVMCDLWTSRDASVELLPIIGGTVSRGLKELTPSVCQRDEG
jgi:hypothetical protein